MLIWKLVWFFVVTHLGAVESRYLQLELLVDVLCAADEAHRGQATTMCVKCVLGSSNHLRVVLIAKERYGDLVGVVMLA